MRRFLLLIGLLVIAVLLIAACSGGSSDRADPYEVYLANNPNPAIVLSRQDAQTRALLGCHTKWAPGTIDAVLQNAYKDLC